MAEVEIFCRNFMGSTSPCKCDGFAAGTLLHLEKQNNLSGKRLKISFNEPVNLCFASFNSVE